MHQCIILNDMVNFMAVYFKKRTFYFSSLFISPLKNAERRAYLLRLEFFKETRKVENLFNKYIFHIQYGR